MLGHCRRERRICLTRQLQSPEAIRVAPGEKVPGQLALLATDQDPAKRGAQDIGADQEGDRVVIVSRRHRAFPLFSSHVAGSSPKSPGAVRPTCRFSAPASAGPAFLQPVQQQLEPLPAGKKRGLSGRGWYYHEPSQLHDLGVLDARQPANTPELAWQNAPSPLWFPAGAHRRRRRKVPRALGVELSGRVVASRSAARRLCSAWWASTLGSPPPCVVSDRSGSSTAGHVQARTGHRRAAERDPRPCGRPAV